MNDLKQDKLKIINENIKIKEEIRILNEKNKNMIISKASYICDQYKCDQCDKHFKRSKTEYLNHTSNCNQCEDCQEIFETGSELDEHFYNTHYNDLNERKFTKLY